MTHDEYLNKNCPFYESDMWIIEGKNRAPKYYPNYALALKKHDPTLYNLSKNEYSLQKNYRRF